MIEIEIGPFVTAFGSVILSWHGLFSFIAVATAVYLVGRWAPIRGINPDDIYSIAVWAIIGGIIGARIVHVVDQWAYYQHNLDQIVAIWRGGIGIWGAILGGLAGGAIYSLINKHPVGIIADITAPALLFAQIIGRLGDIVNGEHCAKATDFFLGFKWVNPESTAGICQNGIGASVHPVIAYEMLWNMIALSILWKLRGRLGPDGMLFTLYLALYAIGRFFVTFAREDRIWAFGMQEAHYIALIVLIVTIPLMAFKCRWISADNVDLSPPLTPGTRAQRRRKTLGR